MLDAVYGCQVAWRRVTAKTIANCFAHCGFVARTPAPEEDEDPEDDVPLAQLLRKLRDVGLPVTKEEEEAFITVDDKLLTSAPATLDDIVEAVKERHEDQDEEEDEDQPEAPTPAAPTMAQVIDATQVLKDALASSSSAGTEEMWHHISALESALAKASVKKLKQKTIQSFFMPPPTSDHTPSKALEDEAEVPKPRD